MEKFIIVVVWIMMSSCGYNRKTNNTDSSKTDSDSPSSDGTDGDTDTDIPTEPAQAPELLYEAGHLHFIEADDTHLYFDQNLSIARALKDGSGEIEILGGASGYSNQNMAMDDEFVYVLWGSSIIKFNKTTEERRSFSLEEYYSDEDDIVVLTADNTRLYSAGAGCRKIISITKDGTEPWAAELERTGYDSGTMTVSVDTTHVYCSGGSAGSTMGRIYRFPKTGVGEFEEVTTAPDIESMWDRGCGSKVGAMTVVDDTVYYINNYADGSCWIQKLAAAPIAGGISTLLAQIDSSSHTTKLLYNIEKESLYFVPLGEPEIIKYNLKDKNLSKLDVTSNPWGILAMDDKYLYFHDDSQGRIYRVKIF